MRLVVWWRIEIVVARLFAVAGSAGSHQGLPHHHHHHCHHHHHNHHHHHHHHHQVLNLARNSLPTLPLDTFASLPHLRALR